MPNWWNPPTPPFAHSASYEVVCSCGSVYRGERRQKHQVVPCTVCGKRVFVLPISPLVSTPVAPAPPAAEPAPAPVVTGYWPWLLPVAAGALTLFLVVAAFAALFLSIWPTRSSAPRSIPGPEALEQALVEGRKALELGDYHFAVEQLDLARAILARHPQALTPAGARRLTQMHRQAHLLVDWPGKSLEDLFREVADVREDDDWRGVVNRYASKAFVVDADVRRDGSGVYHVVARRPAAPTPPIRLHLDGLELLKRLPLTDSRRLLFGARLAEARREKGTCEVYFTPDSGVLLTDVAAAPLGLSPVPGPEWAEIMKRQREWADE